MKPPSEFCTYILELLEQSGLDPAGGAAIRQRAMFGGYGIFYDDLMFGLIARDTLFIKADEESRGAFEAEGMGPFTYTSKRRDGSLSYYEAPPDAVDSPDALLPWAERGVAAARRGAKRKK